MSNLWSFSIIASFILLLGVIALGLFFALFYPPTRIVYDKEKDIMKIGIKNIDRMDRDGKQFEHYLCVLFSALGYQTVYKTKETGDYGADLVFTDSKGNRAVLQAKNYTKGNNIGNDAVQQVYASMPFYKATKAIVVTSSSMTKACEIQAVACNVTIIARSDLIEIIDHFKKGNLIAARRIIERDSRFVEFNPKEKLELITMSNSTVVSGGYYYKFSHTSKKTS